MFNYSYMKLGSYRYLVIILCELPYLLPVPVPGHQSDETSLTGTQCSMYFVQIPSVSASSLLQHVPWFLSVLKRCIPNVSVLVKYDMGNHYKLCYWMLHFKLTRSKYSSGLLDWLCNFSTATLEEAIRDFFVM